MSVCPICKSEARELDKKWGMQKGLTARSTANSKSPALSLCLRALALRLLVARSGRLRLRKQRRSQAGLVAPHHDL